jgi:hypothetical protein
MTLPEDHVRLESDRGTAVHLKLGGRWSSWVRLRVLTNTDEIGTRLDQALGSET